MTDQGPGPRFRTALRSDSAIAFLLAVMTLTAVIAFDSDEMLFLVLAWSVVWIATHTPRWVAGWSLPARRVALAAGGAWSLMWLAMILTRRLEDMGTGWTFADAGLPWRLSMGLTPTGHWPLAANFAWALGEPAELGPPHIYHSNLCVLDLLTAGLVSGIVAALLPSRLLSPALAVCRFLAPAASALAVLLIPFAHWR